MVDQHEPKHDVPPKQEPSWRKDGEKKSQLKDLLRALTCRGASTALPSFYEARKAKEKAPKVPPKEE